MNSVSLAVGSALRRRFGLTAALAVLLLMASPAIEQTSRGTLTGTVLDGTGAVVSNATVKSTQNGTGVTGQTTSNSVGIYRFDAVDLGTYRVTITTPGFATQDKTGVEITAAHTTDIDFALKVGTATEVVSVEASGIEVGLQTSEQVRGETFSARSISTLPIVGGDSLTLAQLAPGVTLASGNSINQAGTFNFAV